MSREVGMVILEKRMTASEASLERCLSELDASGAFPVPPGSLEVAFVDPAECSRLHAAFFRDPEVTDVMTFPGDPHDGHAGDIAICPSVAASACIESGLTFREELTLYLVHAWLHLAGLDDQDPAGRAGMREAEKQLMERLRAAEALLDCTWTA